MKTNYYLNSITPLFLRLNNYCNCQLFFTILMVTFFSMSGYAQKGGGKGTKDIVVRACTQYIGNGLYSVTFGYDNPNKKDVTVNDDDSFVRYNNGNNKTKGVKNFKTGSVNKAFTKQFTANETVEWTVINPNGKVHTVYANANSSHCGDVEGGFIFPVYKSDGKSTAIIGSELSALAENDPDYEPSPLIFQISEEKVLIEIVPLSGEMQNVITLLQNTFGVSASDFLLDLSDLGSLTVIDVYFPISSLTDLNDYANIINFARPLYPSYTNAGAVISQGDGAQTSNVVRESFRLVNSNGDIVPVDGAGIKVGVLSNSYDREIIGESIASLDVSNGELPLGVEVLRDNLFKSSDEGRAMLQIIHDVAPGAALAFHTATASPRQFEVGFKALAGLDESNALINPDLGLKSNIIVDDITFITEPFFGEGRISSSINALTSFGGLHFTSAGNLANKGYAKTFGTSNTRPVPSFISENTAKAHVFGINPDGSDDIYQKISVVPGTYMIVLQWEELAASQTNSEIVSQDLDIYLVDDQGRLIVGNNRRNIAGDPTEIIVFRATGSGEANLMITNGNGATNVPFRYIAFRTSAADGTRDGLKFEEYFENGATTVSGHAMTPASVTVGAVDYRFADNPKAEEFSSYGGSLPNGTDLEIDIYAPDGGNTSVRTIGQLANCETCDKDEYLNFYGTSASAPHAAAATALFMSALPSWFPDGAGSTTYTALQALQLFKSTGKVFTAADSTANNSLINTLNAFKSVASQTAKITELRVEDGKTPSAEPFTVTIIGEFFPDNPQVQFDGKPLTDIVRISDTEITAKVGTFAGNPELTVITESMTPGGTDGGPSDPAYFFDGDKIALNIAPNNAEFEYGQDISLAYTVEGLPLDENGNPVPYESLGLPEVVLNSGADAKLDEGGYPIVFDYAITPSFGGEPYDEELFQINFISGYNDEELGKIGFLTITKKDLTISTEDVSYTYGDAIDAPLIYEYNDAGITDDSGFLSAIDTTHARDFKDGIPNKFEAIVNKFEAIVNDYDLSFLDGGSWSASKRTIENKFEAIVNGMNVINLDSENFINYISAREAFDDGTTNKFEAIVNKFEAIVNAEDLFAGDVLLQIENKFEAIVNKFEAIVNEDDPDNPYGAYAKVFTIINTEDAPTEEDPDRAILQVYAINMITGLDVTSDSESHQVYPGTFLNAMSANFNVTYIPGNLTILPRELTVSTDTLTILYGEALTEQKLLTKTTFDGWAFEGEYQESVETVFPNGVPFYFIKDNVEYEINEVIEFGTYQIKIRHPKNYQISHTYDETHGTLTLKKATLTATTEDLIIKQGEIPQFITNISGYVDGETEDDVFPNGISYYFEDEYGDIFYDTSVPGVFTIRIEDPTNYKIDDNAATLFVNPDDISKIRTYADCVAYDPLASDGLFYTVVYRYENDNYDPIYVLEGGDNNLSGPAQYEGQLPVTFLPGSGIFEIRFDGKKLVWSLTTDGSTHKSSVSSANQSGTGECDAKLDGAYSLYPNPVSNILFVKQNIPENDVSVLVLNMYGTVVLNGGSFNNALEPIEIPFSGLTNGLYIVRIISPSKVRTYNIIKQ